MALKKTGELVGGDGLAEIEPLRLVTMFRLQKCQISSRLNTLGNDAQVKASANVDDCVHDGRPAGVGIDPTNERPVDFESIERELLKIAQAGVARAEVIDRHPNPSFPQNMEDGRRALWSQTQIERGRKYDGFAKDKYYGAEGDTADAAPETQVEAPQRAKPRRGFWRSLKWWS